MKNANAFVADELSVKFKYLHTALNQANQIISTLEQENLRLKDAITNLVSINNEDLSCVFEVNNDRLCSV